jgi:hypothetical protein
MSSDPSLEENVNLLLTKYVTDRFCHQEHKDLNACIAYYVPQHISDSWIDRSLQRQSLKKCEEHSAAFKACVTNEKYAQTVVKRSVAAPSCKVERDTLIRCQKKGAKCTEEYLRLLECGVIHQMRQMKGGDSAEIGRAADAARKQNA